MQIRLVTMKIWVFDMQRINDMQIKDCKRSNGIDFFNIGFL